MNNNLNFIYKTTCLVNGLIYVGKQSKSTLTRTYFGSGVEIKKALKEFGKENFTREILEFCQTPEELCERELFWIKETNCTDPEIGYNIRINSSKGTTGIKMPEDFVKNRSGENSQWFGKTGEDAICFGRTGYKHPMFGIKGEDNPNTGLKRTKERCDAQRGELNPMWGKGKSGSDNPMWGKTYKFTEEQLERRRNKPKLLCPHCKREFDAGNAKLHHFDNCKMNPNKLISLEINKNI